MPDVSAQIRAVGAAIKAIRKQSGLSQGEVAQKAGISIDTVSRIERGENGELETLERIAEALGFTDVVRMIRADEASPSLQTDRDAAKIVQLLPALKKHQRKRLRDAAEQMIASDEE